MKNKSIKWYYADHELILKTGDLLSAPTDVIVNPANGSLSHGGGLAAQILNAAGDALDKESQEIIDRQGRLESGMAVYTTAGQLPYKAVIHAVGPMMGEGHEAEKIACAVTNSLNICQKKNWRSIAFPAISTGIFDVPTEICAQGFLQAITTFWKPPSVQSPVKIFIYLTENNFDIFLSVFNMPGDGMKSTHMTASRDI